MSEEELGFVRRELEAVDRHEAGDEVVDLPEETKLRASLAGARCARDEAMAERDRLRDALKLVYFHLGPPQPRLDDPADIPALVEQAMAERGRLRAVVEVVRAMWDDYVGTGDDATMGFPMAYYSLLEDALDQLDGSGDTGGAWDVPMRDVVSEEEVERYRPGTSDA